MANTRNGRVALITGGGQGIGQAIAERLHADGFNVAIADLNAETAGKVAENLGGGKGGAIALQVDVADRDLVFAAVDKTVAELGGLDVIVNNAGIASTSPIDDITPDSIQKLFSIRHHGQHVCSWHRQDAADGRPREEDRSGCRKARSVGMGAIQQGYYARATVRVVGRGGRRFVSGRAGPELHHGSVDPGRRRDGLQLTVIDKVTWKSGLLPGEPICALQCR